MTIALERDENATPDQASRFIQKRAGASGGAEFPRLARLAGAVWRAEDDKKR
jgi:hypothetical protein